MERLRDGDDLALNDLMARWKEPLVKFCLRYTGNATDARDIAHETFVKVYGSRHRYHPQAAFSTWLFTIATNLCKMRARWRARHPEVLDADTDTDTSPGQGVASTACTAAGPREQADLNALATDIQHATTKLPHDLRATFVLYEINGRPYREIAKILKCTEKAVERRLAKAREHLRSALASKWGHS